MPPLVAADSPVPRVHFGKLTPVLIVDAVEPCLAFWTERLGFTQANAVPGEDGRLVFGSVERAMVGVPVVKARHETFYGTAELYVREPGGTTVGFSMRLPSPPGDT